ncbi:hypothetical protein [Cellulomonas palmilytica]|uniref:hypothetical protein n=1 Tax=Cellulomonas palmilytica TaxID=2608402 RepID=UPI001F2050D3|nr:hypothetical protein [Cellulomonas palmilytica]UJP40686.1 hypothetical protein F1D97_04075 [Cellulomonas palmilytica]
MLELEAEPLTDWLRGRRRSSQIDQRLMSLHFDLEGARRAGQAGLLWYTQERMLLVGLLRFAVRTGAHVATLPGTFDEGIAALDTLGLVNPQLADRAWALLERTVPETAEELETEVQRTLGFLRDTLDAGDGSRAGATRSWAEGVRVLRSVSSSIGLAADDDWYLAEPSAVELGDWYDQVLAQLAGDPAR